jgi:acetyl esterase/lipase
MDKKRILLADTRSGERDAVGEYRDYRDWAIEVGVDLDIVKVKELQLQELVAQIGDNIHGLLLLRDSASSVSGEELEKQLAAVSIPLAEVFIYDLGGHRFVDRTEPGCKVLRTIYGRLQRGVRWGLHFLKYCEAHPYTTLPYGTHSSHIGDLFLPEGEGPFPVVMLIHGGFWRDGYYRDSMHGLAADLAKRGYAAWNVEYRRVGPSGGGYPESMQDVLQALNYLRELPNAHQLDLSRVAVVGHSAGGYLSIWAGSIPAGDLKKIMPVPQVKVKLGVSLAGVTDLDEAHKSGGGDQAATHFLKSAADDEALRKQLSAGYLQYDPDTKLMLVHGSNDDYVPVELSKYTLELLLARGEENVELFLFPNSGHNEFVDPESMEWQKVVQRMEVLL